MPFALLRAPTGDLGAAAELIQNSRLRWLQFGSDFFCHGSDIAEPTTAARFKAAGIACQRLTVPQGPAGQLRDDHLHLVIQEGTHFRRAHPDIPVLLDKGRHMLVALDPVRAGCIAQHQARFALRPVVQNQVIFDVAVRAGSYPKANVRTRQAVDALSRSHYASALGELVSYPARHSLSSHFHDAARRARDRLRAWRR